MSYPDYLGSWAQTHSQRNLCHSLYGSFYGQSKNIWGVGGHGKDYETAGMDVSIGEYFNEDWTSSKTYIPTEENSILNIHILQVTLQTLMEHTEYVLRLFSRLSTSFRVQSGSRNATYGSIAVHGWSGRSERLTWPFHSVQRK